MNQVAEVILVLVLTTFNWEKPGSSSRMETDMEHVKVKTMRECQLKGEQWNDLNSEDKNSPRYRYVCLGPMEEEEEEEDGN